jgi:hypothetical protein
MAGNGLLIRGANHAATYLLRGRVLIASGGAASPLVAGAISLVSVTQTSVSLSATEATGGTGAITHQWSRATNALGPFSNIGSNSLLLSDTGLTASTVYFYRLTYTDSLGQSATATFSASTQAVSSTTLTIITIAKSLTFATGGGSTGTGYGSVVLGESLAIFAQFTASSGTLQIIGTPKFTILDKDNNIIVDEVPVALQSSIAAQSVLMDYVFDTRTLAAEGEILSDARTRLPCWFDASLLDMNGQTQNVRCEGVLMVESRPT